MTVVGLLDDSIRVVDADKLFAGHSSKGAWPPGRLVATNSERVFPPPLHHRQPTVSVRANLSTIRTVLAEHASAQAGGKWIELAG